MNLIKIIKKTNKKKHKVPLLKLCASVLLPERFPVVYSMTGCTFGVRRAALFGVSSKFGPFA